MPLIIKILKFIARALGFSLGAAGGAQHASKYIFRALAVTAMSAAFWVAFNIMYNAVKDALDIAVTHAQAAQGTLGNIAEFGFCLLPSTLPEAITVIITIALQATAVRWTRMVLFAKLA